MTRQRAVVGGTDVVGPVVDVDVDVEVVDEVVDDEGGVVDEVEGVGASSQTVLDELTNTGANDGSRARSASRPCTQPYTVFLTQTFSLRVVSSSGPSLDPSN
jgi:hypothetical protein